MARPKKRKKKKGRRSRPPARPSFDWDEEPILEGRTARAMEAMAQALASMAPAQREQLLRGDLDLDLDGFPLGAGFLEDFPEDDDDDLFGDAAPMRLDPKHPERCKPAIPVRRGGGSRPDPHALLGTTPDASAEEIRAAYRQRAIERPPELDPEAASARAEARSLLLDPERVWDRILGAVQLPDPEKWGMEPAAEGGAPPGQMSSLRRLGAQLLLYALAEQEIERLDEERRISASPTQGSLFS